MRQESELPEPGTRLLAWYAGARRHLPWRAVPGQHRDPYRVWLSEIMLQQTVVKAATPYFTRFIAQWPTVRALADAPLDDVLRQWAGLGYYARARNLHACARQIVLRHDGIFPHDEAALLALPGIGRYTAAAIRAIAFEAQCVPVDGNVERVMARYFAVETPLPAAKRELSRLAQSLLPVERPGDLAQALMDLGASLCSPKSPACALCPLAQDCRAHSAGIVVSLPHRLPRKARPVRHASAFVALRADGAVMLRRRPDKGLLGAMTEVPSGDWLEGGDFVSSSHSAPITAHWRLIPGEVRHVFTHFEFRVEVWRADVDLDCASPDGCFWVQRQALDREALPSVMKKIAAHALEAPVKVR